MSIETTEDWNERMSCLGCCSMPTIDISLASEQIPAIAIVNGYYNNADTTFYLEYAANYSGGGSIVDEWSPSYYGSVGTGTGAQVVVYPNGYTQTTTPPLTGTLTVVLSNANAVAAAISAGEAAIAGDLDWTLRGKVSGSSAIRTISGAQDSTHTFRYYRGRFKIGSEHTGNHCLITYDILEEPTVGSPSLITVDATIAWTGPGDPGDPNDESWFTGWIYIDPPSVEGSRRIVNIRYQILTTSRYGVKPQITGEAYP